MIFGTGTTLTLQDAFCMKKIPAIICMSQRFRYAPHNLTVGLSKKKTASQYILHSSYYQPPLLAFWPRHHCFHPKIRLKKYQLTSWFFNPRQILLGVRCVPTLQVSPPWYILRTHGIIWNDLKRIFFGALKKHLRRHRHLETDLKQDFKWSSIGCLWWMKSSLEGYKH